MTQKVINKVASLVEEQRNEHPAQTIIKNLQRRLIEGFYCPTGEEAVKKAHLSQASPSKQGRDLCYSEKQGQGDNLQGRRW
jgi:hypothetical protein